MSLSQQTHKLLTELEESKVTVHLAKQVLQEDDMTTLSTIDVPSSSDWISQYEVAKEEIQRLANIDEERVMEAVHDSQCDLIFEKGDESIYIEAKGANSSTEYNIRAGNGQFLLEADAELNSTDTYVLAVPATEAEECWSAWTNNDNDTSWELDATLDKIDKENATAKVALCTEDEYIAVSWREFFKSDFTGLSSKEILEYYKDNPDTLTSEGMQVDLNTFT